ncbi:MAG: GNAT family N-acetyltransferase [Bacteroidales bacterium]
MIIRTNVKPEDIENVREIVTSTRFFHDYEIDVAIELVRETLNKGSDSGYNFIFVELDNKIVAYSCFGLIPCTQSSYDLYWIAVHNNYRNKGIGKKLLAQTEKFILDAGGTAVYAETSSQELYEPTRRFYIFNNYNEEARLKDYYKQGDDKIVYSKRLRY